MLEIINHKSILSKKQKSQFFESLKRKINYVDKPISIEFDISDQEKWFDFDSGNFIFPFKFANSIKQAFKYHTGLNLVEQFPRTHSMNLFKMVTKMGYGDINLHLNKIVNYSSKNLSSNDIKTIKQLIKQSCYEYNAKKVLIYDKFLCDQYVDILKNDDFNYDDFEIQNGYFFECESYCIYIIRTNVSKTILIKFKSGEVINFSKMEDKCCGPIFHTTIINSQYSILKNIKRGLSGDIFSPTSSTNKIDPLKKSIIFTSGNIYRKIISIVYDKVVNVSVFNNVLDINYFFDVIIDTVDNNNYCNMDHLYHFKGTVDQSNRKKILRLNILDFKNMKIYKCNGYILYYNNNKCILYDNTEIETEIKDNTDAFNCAIKMNFLKQLKNKIFESNGIKNIKYVSFLNDTLKIYSENKNEMNITFKKINDMQTFTIKTDKIFYVSHFYKNGLYICNESNKEFYFFLKNNNYFNRDNDCYLFIANFNNTCKKYFNEEGNIVTFYSKNKNTYIKLDDNIIYDGNVKLNNIQLVSSNCSRILNQYLILPEKYKKELLIYDIFDKNRKFVTFDTSNNMTMITVNNKILFMSDQFYYPIKILLGGFILMIKGFNDNEEVKFYNTEYLLFSESGQTTKFKYDNKSLFIDNQEFYSDNELYTNIEIEENYIKLEKYIKNDTEFDFSCTEIKIKKCGNGQSINKNNYYSREINRTSVNINSKTGCSKVSHNGDKLYEKNNGVVVKNKIKMGYLTGSETIVWKFAYVHGGDYNGNLCIVKLCIPKEGIHIKPLCWFKNISDHRKERCSMAIVLDIQQYNFDEEISISNVEAISEYGGTNGKLIYKVGEIVYPDSFDTSENQCSNGIHVFSSRLDIAKYRGMLHTCNNPILKNSNNYTTNSISDNIKKLLKDAETQTDDDK